MQGILANNDETFTGLSAMKDTTNLSGSQGLADLDESLGQSLSALLDGEADELSLKRILSQEDQATVNNAWVSLLEQQEILQGKQTAKPFGNVSLLAGIQAGIADEVLPEQAAEPANQERPSWFRPVANLAVAASVAMVTVFAVNQFNSNDAVNTPQPQTFAATQLEQAAPVNEVKTAKTTRVYPVSIARTASTNGIMAQPVSADFNFENYVADEVSKDKEIQRLIQRYHSEQSIQNR